MRFIKTYTVECSQTGEFTTFFTEDEAVHYTIERIIKDLKTEYKSIYNEGRADQIVDILNEEIRLIKDEHAIDGRYFILDSELCLPEGWSVHSKFSANIT